MADMSNTIQPFVTALTTSVTPSDIIGVLAPLVGVGMGFVVMWFGVRQAKKIFTRAFSKGRI